MQILLVVLCLNLVITSTIVFFLLNKPKPFMIKTDLNLERLLDVQQKIVDKLEIAENDIGLLNDSNLIIKEGIITKMDLHLAVNKEKETEYWQIQSNKSGITLMLTKKLKKKLPIEVTLKMMFNYIILVNEVVGNSEFNANFSATKHSSINDIAGESYNLIDEKFQKINVPLLIESYAINVHQDKNYLFYYQV